MRYVFFRVYDLLYAGTRGCVTRDATLPFRFCRFCNWHNCAILITDCATKIVQWKYVATVEEDIRGTRRISNRNHETIKRDITHPNAFLLISARISESVNHIPADYRRQFRIDPVVRPLVLFVDFNSANDSCKLPTYRGGKWWNSRFYSAWNATSCCLLLECYLAHLLDKSWIKICKS